MKLSSISFCAKRNIKIYRYSLFEGMGGFVARLKLFKIKKKTEKFR